MKPILFSTPMVQAILNDHKTATRRVVKPQPVLDESGMWHWKYCQWMDGGIGFPASGIKDHARYHPGDVLWVRETWSTFSPTYGTAPKIIYIADEYTPAVMMAVDKGEIKWRPSIHMPFAAARLFLRVTAVHMERLHDITEEQAEAEGAYRAYPYTDTTSGETVFARDDRAAYRGGFSAIWEHINAKRDGGAYAWGNNPWVWAIEFERCEKPERSAE